MKSNEKAFLIGAAIIADILFHQGKITLAVLEELADDIKEDEKVKQAVVTCEKCNCKLYIGKPELLNLNNLPQVCKKGGCHTLKITVSDEK